MGPLHRPSTGTAPSSVLLTPATNGYLSGTLITGTLKITNHHNNNNNNNDISSSGTMDSSTHNNGNGSTSKSSSRRPSSRSWTRHGGGSRTHNNTNHRLHTWRSSYNTNTSNN
jgi:hypothetical protein